jgi:AAA family ATP:ADP antiporter
MAIRREELPETLLMSFYFFLVIATFWVLRPLKTGLFIEYYDQVPFRFLLWDFNAAQAQNIAKVGNMLVAVVAAAAFVYLSRTFQRERLTHIFAGFSIAGFAVLATLLRDPSAGTVWGFYWWGDLYNTLMVAAFFAFLNDAVTPDSAKRLYGVVVLGGVTGGAFGSIVLANWISALTMSQWMWVSAVLTVLVGMTASMAGRRFHSKDEAPPRKSGKTTAPEPAARTSLATASRIVLGSRYLLSIVAIVGLYEMVSTIMDFQFSSTISYYLDGDAISERFALVFAVTNGVALFIQLFITSFVMTRFGIGVALLFLPVAALLGSVGFLAAPILLTGSLLNTTDSGFAYSINQSAKEALYTPTHKSEKYQAKAFIDMFVMRFAKAVAVGLSLVLTTMFTGFGSVRWLSLVTVAILAAWIVIARYAGREFQKKATPGQDTARAARPDPSPSVVSAR